MLVLEWGKSARRELQPTPHSNTGHVLSGEGNSGAGFFSSQSR